ncbi:MAG: hypothetical protein QW594_01645 [Candidatus Woesearchaeota archaeon]
MNALQEQFARFFMEAAKLQGIHDDALVQIWAVLYLEPEEISMEELAEMTGYSLSTISMKLKILESLTPLKKYHKPRTKKIFVFMEKDILFHAKEVLTKKQKALIELGKQQLPKLIAQAIAQEQNKKSKESKQEAFLRKRKQRQILESYYTQLLEFETILASMLALLDAHQQKTKNQ